MRALGSIRQGGWRHLATAVLFLGCNSAFGQIYTFQTYGRELQVSEAVAPIPEGFGRFGEDVDFNNGSVSFRKTVVDLKGNNSLRVAAEFEYRLVEPLGGQAGYQWVRARPYISGVHSSDVGWVLGVPGAYTNLRCSSTTEYSVATAVRSVKQPIENFVPQDYWDGNSLMGVAGGGIVRRRDPAEPTIPGVDARWATNEGWRFSCYLLADGSEGFLGHAPNGDKYYFGLPERQDGMLEIRSNGHAGADTWLEVSEYRMYLDRIEDRYGNWANYSSSQIESSDGRLITFESAPILGADGMIVRANGREWKIGTGGGYVRSILNPDGSTWSISQTGSLFNNYPAFDDTCVSQASLTSGYSGQIVVSITLESGANGIFTIAPMRRGFSYVPYICRIVTFSGPRYADRPDYSDNFALISRSVQGPGVVYKQHVLDYGPVNACFAPVSGVPVPDVCSPSSPTTRTVTVTGSDGSVDQYVFGNKVGESSGLLLSKTTGALSVESYKYSLPYVNLSSFGKRKVYDVRENHVVVTSERSVLQDGLTFIYKVATDCGAGSSGICLDNFFRPTKTIRSSSP